MRRTALTEGARKDWSLQEFVSVDLWVFVLIIKGDLTVSGTALYKGLHEKIKINIKKN